MDEFDLQDRTMCQVDDVFELTPGINVEFPAINGEYFEVGLGSLCFKCDLNG